MHGTVQAATLLGLRLTDGQPLDVGAGVTLLAASTGAVPSEGGSRELQNNSQQTCMHVSTWVPQADVTGIGDAARHTRARAPPGQHAFVVATHADASAHV